MFSYKANLLTTEILANDAWTLLKASETAGYLMGTGTEEAGNDQVTNACGVA